ncbi:MAG: hypothetical protein ACK42F_00055, partial [Sphingobacteriales bacterium]
MKKLIVLFYLLLSLNLSGQRKFDSLLTQVLSQTKSSVAQSVLSNPDSFRVQIIYTQINRDKTGKPDFTNYYY